MPFQVLKLLLCRSQASHELWLVVVEQGITRNWRPFVIVIALSSGSLLFRVEMSTVSPEHYQRFLIAMDRGITQPALFVDALHGDGLLFGGESVNCCLQTLNSRLFASTG